MAAEPAGTGVPGLKPGVDTHLVERFRLHEQIAEYGLGHTPQRVVVLMKVSCVAVGP